MIKKLDRRHLLETAAWLTFWGAQEARAAVLGGPRSGSPRSVRSEKLLIVVTANGGASIVDSFLPLLGSEQNQQLRSYKPADIDIEAGSAFACVRPIPYTLGVPVDTTYEMRTFLRRHGSDAAVVTHSGTSVNHLIAAQRSLNGNGVNRGRTLMEAVAAQHGRHMLLPNINMGLGGYGLSGSDPELPREARAEAVADALLFPLALDRNERIAGRASSELLDAARQVRRELDQKFHAKYQQSALLADFVRYQANIPKLEAAQLLEALMFFDQARLGPALSRDAVAPSPLLAKVRTTFPAYASDPLEAQAALAFLLLRYGLSTSVTLGLDDLVRFSEEEDSKEILHLPLAFDWSHNHHQGAQNSMWRRLLSTMDRFIQLLKDEDYLGQPEAGKIWERSLLYVATEFGRDREKRTGSGHHLNNGSLLLSPRLNGNRIYGGLDPLTGLTYGFDPLTAEPDPKRQLEEADLYSLVLQILEVEFSGQRSFPALRKTNVG